MIAKYIGEALLAVIALPLFAYQTAESLHALADVFAQMTDYFK
ncbi:MULTISPECIES: hypothetical protein [Brevibacillus]|jgi:hypothetical protein|uniref:Uncharacterized protein n=1 Tax=Brevibacillus borstelensis AK1 TaxID=1300222 RepID=M8E7I6_9BACL|nr:hypothetical protein [Brevibacillus borstelensis]EMT51425.1 hypothetical protein I532_17768 [Brevibacillus borstelensis AK1]MED1743801.1 hypothetical protein [Brevibacillus borstelensis]MED1851603.1 hypothetical protein [Brevibacillus borstelensis]MED1875234.1 hypothetical protein [Brevibacillus borstelensis]MED1884284.1 hypothetical protein [Brevibacillus borstelensis]